MSLVSGANGRTKMPRMNADEMARAALWMPMAALSCPKKAGDGADS